MPETPLIRIRCPEDWKAALQAQAAREGWPHLGPWLLSLGLDRLPARVRRKLSDPPRPGRPPKSNE